jgi:hypothetical protein
MSSTGDYRYPQMNFMSRGSTAILDPIRSGASMNAEHKINAILPQKTDFVGHPDQRYDHLTYSHGRDRQFDVRPLDTVGLAGGRAVA